jgi:hypothetical protein
LVCSVHIVFIQTRFCSSKSDPLLFVLHRGNSTTYLLLCIDDIILTDSHTSLLSTIIHQLRSEFAMTDLGPLAHFLVILVQCTRDGLFLSQQQYALELLDRAHMSNCNPCLTPADTKSKPSLSDGNPLSNPMEYHSLAGALQYLKLTRLDICFVVQQACFSCILPPIDICICSNGFYVTSKELFTMGFFFPSPPPPI